MRLNTYITYKKRYPIDIQKDLIFRTNNTNIIDLWCYNEDDMVVDITGATVFFTVKEKPSDTDSESGSEAVIQKDITELTNPSGGNTEIEITPEDCENLLGNYVYDIKIQMSDDKIYSLAEGNICFRKEITTRIV